MIIRGAPAGRSLRALGADETAASAMGVPVVRRRVQIFVFSAMCASIAGSLYTHYLNYANATFFDFTMTVHLVAILVVGGIGTLWGPILGSIVLIGVSQNLGAYGDYSLLIFGILYATALLFLPRGIAGELPRLFARRHVTPATGRSIADPKPS